MWYGKTYFEYDEWCPSIIVTEYCDYERKEYIEELTKELEKPEQDHE